MGDRVKELVARLRKGARKTAETFVGLSDEQWRTVLYEGPPAWTVRDVMAHFLSAEEELLRMGRDVAAGGRGVPEGFDYDAFNRAEQMRLAGIPADQLLVDLGTAREATIAWVARLAEADLDRVGYHPVLGEITLGAFINTFYAHQLLHVRDLKRMLA